jgi:subtilisin family serine protease
VATVARTAGVKALYPVAAASLPPGQPQDDPDLATALAMTGADAAQSELGWSGAGVRVGVLDTGIDYHHPDLGACFGPGCRVAAGYDFVGDAFNADQTSPGYNPKLVPDPDPDDCNGHGTHVAGIIGASGAARGVAPGVTFGAYRVFGCEGSTTADVMIAAMERALADGMHVLNISIGADYQWPRYPTAQAADRLVNKGMVVVASIGNDAATGVYSAGAPGVGEKVIGVASFDNTHTNLPTFALSPDNRPIAYQQATAAPFAPLSGGLPLARTGTPSSTSDGCDALPAGSLAGKVALIRRGLCASPGSLYIKARNAQTAGAAAVVLYNNVPGRFVATVAPSAPGAPPVTIPVVTISDVDGVLINNRLAAGPVSLAWTDRSLGVVNPTGGQIAATSSYGLAPDLSLKPDIGAPGGLIRSTYPLEQGGYRTVSGTSMASPHVAGGVALLLQARPRTPAQAVRGILQNSADPKEKPASPSNPRGLDNVHRQGAGMLDIDGAILSTTKIEPAKLSLGESAAGPTVRTLTIENNGAAAVTYDLSHAPALSTGGSTFAPSFAEGFATLAFSPASVTAPAGGAATVAVTITANPGLADRGLYGGYVVLTPQGGGPVQRVPYAGFKGDYQSIQVLTPTPSGFPWLATRVGTTYRKQANGATYTLQGGDLPYILLHRDHQARRLRLEVRAADSGRAWHRALDLEYLGRNSAATSFFALPWDGVTMNGRQINDVPDGKYVIVLSVQKALGDDDPTSWETWTSPPITIDRP